MSHDPATCPFCRGDDANPPNWADLLTAREWEGYSLAAGSDEGCCYCIENAPTIARLRAEASHATSLHSAVSNLKRITSLNAREYDRLRAMRQDFERERAELRLIVDLALDVSLAHSCSLEGWDESCPECRLAKKLYYLEHRKAKDNENK